MTSDSTCVLLTIEAMHIGMNLNDHYPGQAITPRPLREAMKLLSRSNKW